MSSNESTKSPSIVMACPLCRSEFPEGTINCVHDGCQLVQALPDPLLGSTFAERYEIVEKLGTGGMSVVYKARQKYMDNFVAIKVLHPQLGADPVNFERFLQEAKAAASLKHPNIVQVFDFGTSDGKAFLIMELLEGQTLDLILEDNGRLPVGRALNIFTQACDGLFHAHSKGIIHRDLKPGNLALVQESGKEIVKVVDFGIAKIIPQDGSKAQELTAAGEVFGSPLYMSPEQCQGKTLDARSDIYSLGCVMYETITGMPPLMGANSFETMNMHVGERPQTMRLHAPDLDIPEAIDSCVMKTLKKEANRRPQTMLELKDDLIAAAFRSNVKLPSHEAAYNGLELEAGGPNALPSAVARVAASGNTKDMHQLVLDAVALTEKQDKKNKQLKVMLAGVYAMLGMLLVSMYIFFTTKGPAQDPATPWQRLRWRHAMENGDRDLDGKRYKEAIEEYKKAVVIGGEIGDFDDKKVKSLMWLSIAYHYAKEEDKARDLRRQIVMANLRHMDQVVALAKGDFAQVVDLDESRISNNPLDPAHVAPQSLDKQTLDEYSAALIARARTSMQNKEYKKAESWLEEAVELEEQVHGLSKGALSAAVSQLGQCKDPDARSHMAEIQALLVRARKAEQ
jgi:serine/threonine protein kinase